MTINLVANDTTNGFVLCACLDVGEGEKEWFTD